MLAERVDLYSGITWVGLSTAGAPERAGFGLAGCTGSEHGGFLATADITSISRRQNVEWTLLLYRISLLWKGIYV